MWNLKNEIKRVQGIQENSVMVDRQTYLRILKELKTLRFKMCSKLYWTREKTDINKDADLSNDTIGK